MSTATTICEASPVERDSSHFFIHLNELVGHLKLYLVSGGGTLGEECCKMMREAFEFWEEFCLKGTAEQVAPVIATSTPEILQVFHEFMSKVSSGQ